MWQGALGCSVKYATRRRGTACSLQHGGLLMQASLRWQCRTHAGKPCRGIRAGRADTKADTSCSPQHGDLLLGASLSLQPARSDGAAKRSAGERSQAARCFCRVQSYLSAPGQGGAAAVRCTQMSAAEALGLQVHLMQLVASPGQQLAAELTKHWLLEARAQPRDMQPPDIISAFGEPESWLGVRFRVRVGIRASAGVLPGINVFWETVAWSRATDRHQ